MNDCGNHSFEDSRRAFAKGGLGLGLGLAVGSPTGGLMAQATVDYEPKSFTPSDFIAVKTLMERLIPASAQSGSAVEACAHIYLDRALGAHYAQHADTYRAGLGLLDRFVRQASRAGLEAMKPSEIDDLIARMEKGELTGAGFPDGGVSFFNLVRRHTLEGFLSDPMYGGNKDFLGWKVIGYRGVQVYYSDAAQQLNGPDDRRQQSIAVYGGKPLW